VHHAMGSSAFPARGILPQEFGLNTPSWKPDESGAAYLAAATYPHGERFPQVTLILPRDPKLHELGLTLRRSWQRYLGVDVAIRQLNLSNYIRVLDARAFDLAFVRWGADYPDPQDFLASQLGPSSNNVTGWSGKKYDRLVPLADSYNPHDPRRTAMFTRAASLAMKRIPILPMDEPAQEALIRPALKGVALTPLGTVYLNPSSARFDSR
jgi:oligopeptide transport system substrate-binding protein